MNDADVSKQIQEMVCFILQEAEEKASEISVSAEEEFNIEKLQLVEAEKKKIRQEYEQKEKQVQVHKKIEYSMQLNASRIKVLQAQDDLVNAMKEAASKELLNVSGDHGSYKHLLKDLIVQIAGASLARALSNGSDGPEKLYAAQTFVGRCLEIIKQFQLCLFQIDWIYVLR